MQAAQHGDREALARIYDHLFPKIYGYVAHRVPTIADAEDLVAQTWLKAIGSLPAFKGRRPLSFQAWMFQIARRLVADYYRRPAPEEVVEPIDLDGFTAPELPPEAALADKQRNQRLTQLVHGLSPRRREVIALRYFGGLRNHEIAALLDLDERTVASHVSRALDDLQASLKGETVDD